MRTSGSAHSLYLSIIFHSLQEKRGNQKPKTKNLTLLLSLQAVCSCSSCRSGTRIGVRKAAFLQWIFPRSSSFHKSTPSSYFCFCLHSPFPPSFLLSSISLGALPLSLSLSLSRLFFVLFSFFSKTEKRFWIFPYGNVEFFSRRFFLFFCRFFIFFSIPPFKRIEKVKKKEKEREGAKEGGEERREKKKKKKKKKRKRRREREGERERERERERRE